MSFSLGTMTKYADEISFDLMTAALYQGQSLKHVRIVSGYGDTFKVPVLANTITLQNDACNMGSSGTSTITQVTISPCDLAYVNDLCVKDLREYFTSTYMPMTMNKSDVLPFEEMFFADIAAGISKKVDTIFWQGDDDLSCTGILDLLINTAYSSSTISQSSGATGVSVGSIIASVDNLVAAYGFDTIEKDSTLWMSPSNYRKLLIAYKNANYYNPADINNAEGVFVLGSLNVTARPTAGITDAALVLAANDNLVFGTLNDQDHMNITAKYDDYRDLLRIKASWRQGAQVIFPSQVAILTIA